MSNTSRLQPEVLKDITDPSVTAAIKGSLCAFFRFFGRSSGVETHEEGSLLRWYTGVQHPWFNGVLTSAPPAGDIEETIASTSAYFKSKGVNVISWWLEPGVQMYPWANALGQHGFRYSDSDPGMAVEISRLKDGFIPPASFSLRQVENLELLQVWMEVFTAGYGLPQSVGAYYFNVLSGLGLELPLRHYLGFMGDTPVATASLFLARGVAGIYNVSTLGEVRGMGIGSMMTAHPLQEASEMGYKVGVLQSSEMGFQVYRRLGFEKLCTIDYFYQFL